MPRNPGRYGRDTRGRPTGRLADGKCHRKSDRRRPFEAVRVKRCGKSAPREAQATRHGKPRPVQGQIGNPGATRSQWRESATDSGYRLLRQMILSLEQSGQTEFGLQPRQNHFHFCHRSKIFARGVIIPPSTATNHLKVQNRTERQPL